MNTENSENTRSVRIREHLANERTFLAWIRTNIGIMAFGFVVEKFSYFMKQIVHLSGANSTHITGISDKGYLAHFGIFLVSFGALMSLVAFFNFRETAKQIEGLRYMTKSALAFVLTLIIFGSGIFLVIYLL